MNSAIDVRSQFRLNGMDLVRQQPTVSAGPQHWMLTEPRLRSWVEDLERAYGRLVAAGFQPFGDEPVTSEAMIDALGFWDEPRPSGVLGYAKFTARLLAASTREGLRIEREIVWLRRNRPRTE